MREGNGRGVYFSFGPGEWGKNMSYCGWLGEKYDDSIRKNANIEGKRWKKWGKEEIFTVLGGKNISLGKRGEDINYLYNIHPRGRD